MKDLRRLVDTGGLEAKERRLEEGLRGTEPITHHENTLPITPTVSTNTNSPFITDGDDLAIRKLVALLKGGRLRSSLHFLLKVERDVAELLLDVTDNFTLRGGRERVPTLHENLDEVVGEIASGKVETEDRVRERETFVDGHSVRDTITRVKHDTGRTTGRVQGQDGLDRDVECRRVERLEHDLRHLLSVGLCKRVRCSISRYTEFHSSGNASPTLGLRGASVSRTGCSSGATRSSL
jgi:hypothetical protein